MALEPLVVHQQFRWCWLKHAGKVPRQQQRRGGASPMVIHIPSEMME